MSDAILGAVVAMTAALMWGIVLNLLGV